MEVKMKKVLIVSSVASMIDLFNMNNISILQKMGCHVDIACNFDDGNITSSERIKEFKEILDSKNINFFNIPIPRNITSIRKILISYELLYNIIKNNKYDMVHCHSPIGGVITRIATKKYNSIEEKRLNVIYTAHGFHFYKGAKLRNWLLFYPIEKFLSRHTDCLITINGEDYRLAKSKMKAKNVEYLPGIGINTKSLEKKHIINSPNEENFTLVSIGQLSQRKNHEIIIKSLAEIKDPTIFYNIIGIGELELYLKKLVEELELNNQIKFLGFQKNVSQFLTKSDCFVFPSIQEGLPVSLMEAMATPLPVICSKIRGNVDLIDNNLGGFLIENGDINEYIFAIKKLKEDYKLRVEFSEYNRKKIKKYDVDVIDSLMEKIYRKYLFSI